MVKHCSIIFALVLLILPSCKKQSAVELDQSFEGVWRHDFNATEIQYLDIGAGSYGYIQNYKNNELQSDTQQRKWLVKNDKLFFGWLASGNEKFSIDQYPETAVDTITQGNKIIYPGQKFMVLDGRYYRSY